MESRQILPVDDSDRPVFRVDHDQVVDLRRFEDLQRFDRKNVFVDRDRPARHVPGDGFFHHVGIVQCAAPKIAVG